MSPNWVSCDFSVRIPYFEGKGKEASKQKAIKELREFASWARTGKELIDFRKFIPYPKEFVDMDREQLIHAQKYKAAWTRYMNKLGRDPNADESKKFWDDYHRKHPAVKDGFNSGGYEWCCENWGTKWNACHTELGYMQDDEVMYHFDTAWSPANPVILAMSKKFPILEFTLTYFECGCAFHGVFQCKEGKVTRDDTAEYFGDRGG